MQTKWPVWLGVALGLTAIAGGLLVGENQVDRWELAARWTARASFPMFILTFIASAMVRLWPTRSTKALLRDRRYWGIGFASTFGLHVLALLVNNWNQDNFPPVGPFDPGAIITYVLIAMVITSTDAARRQMGKWWKVLHRTGMWGFWTIFSVQPYLEAIFTLTPPKQNPLTDPYTMTCFVAVLLKLAAWTRSARRHRTA